MILTMEWEELDSVGGVKQRRRSGTAEDWDPIEEVNEWGGIINFSRSLFDKGEENFEEL